MRENRLLRLSDNRDSKPIAMSGGFALLILLCLTGCGGRVAKPVAVTNSFDDALSCTHMRGERDNNNKRLEELIGERGEAQRDNLGFLVVSPLFLDVSNTRKTETEALLARNERLAALMTARGCVDIDLPETNATGVTSDDG